jgi:hypothetical protein
MSRLLTLPPCMLLLAVAMMAGGCGAMYVNIPRQPGDVASHDVDDPSVRAVSAEALRAAIADRRVSQVNVILPAGMQPASVEQVLDRVGKEAPWQAHHNAPELPSFEVRQVRVRGWRAQVDVIRPASADHRELVTVHLRRYPVGGWAATQLYLWRIPVDEALRESVRIADVEAPPAGAEALP